MRWVIVNGRPKSAEETYCAFCTLRIGQSYLREVGTNIVYHNPFCFDAHVLMSAAAIGGGNAEYR